MTDFKVGEGSRDLNFPDIASWLEDQWLLAMDGSEDSPVLKETDDAVNSMLNLCKERGRERVAGVRVFKS